MRTRRPTDRRESRKFEPGREIGLEERISLSDFGGGQSHFPPGQFPAGNPAQAPGNSNTPGNSGK
jgi:hypothetical protein